MKELARKLLVLRTDRTMVQFFRYFFVGGLSAVVDMGALFVMTSVFHIHYLVSAAIAFIAGMVTNYLLSTAWVFQSKGNKRKEFILFAAIGATGLMWNEVILWVMVSQFGLHYLLAKLVSTGVVFIWNFGMRKRYVF